MKQLTKSNAFRVSVALHVNTALRMSPRLCWGVGLAKDAAFGPRRGRTLRNVGCPRCSRSEYMRLSKEPRGLTSNRGKASSGRTQWGQLGIQCGEVSSVLVDGRAATFLRAEGDVATCGATCHAASKNVSGPRTLRRWKLIPTAMPEDSNEGPRAQRRRGRRSEEIKRVKWFR